MNRIILMVVLMGSCFQVLWGQTELLEDRWRAVKRHSDSLVEEGDYVGAKEGWATLAGEAHAQGQTAIWIAGQAQIGTIMARYEGNLERASGYLDSIGSLIEFPFPDSATHREFLDVSLLAGFIAERLGDFPLALQWYERAAFLFFSSPTSPQELIPRIFGSAGNIYTRMGDYEAAELRLSYGFRWAIRERNPKEMVRFSSDLGILFEDSEQLPHARRTYEKVLPILDQVPSLDHGTYLLNYAITLDRLQQQEPTISHEGINGLLDTAEQQFKLARQVENSWRVYSKLGFLERVQGERKMETGQWEKAHTHFEQSLAWLYQGEPQGSRREFGKTLVPMAKNYRQQGQIEKALQTLQAALQHNLTHYSPSSMYDLPPKDSLYLENNLWESLWEMALCHEELFHQTDSISYLKRALDCHQLMYAIEQLMHQTYSRFGSKELLSADRHARTGHALELGWHMFQITQEQSYIEQAFLAAEQGKANVLLEKWQDRGYVERGIISGDWVQKMEPGERKQQKAWLKEVQKSLRDNGQVLVEYWLAEEELFIFVVDSTRIQLLKQQLEAPLADHVLSFRTTIQAMNRSLDLTQRPSTLNDFAQRAHSWYQLLIEPVEKAGFKDLKRWVVVPDGALFLLPFSTLISRLPDGRSDFDLTYLPYAFSSSYSARFFHLNSQPSSLLHPTTYLGVAPQTFHRLPALHGSEAFVESWQTALGGEVLTGNEASRSQIFREAPESSLLVFFTHAKAQLASDQLKSEPVLYLSGTDSVSMDDLAHPDVQLQAELALLLACETQVGRIAPGEGMAGLGESFFLAGCQSTIATYWSTSSQETQEMGNYLMEFLSAGWPKDLSLLKAQEKFRAQRSALHYSASPFYWGSMSLSGNPLPLRLNQGKDHSWSWYGLGLVIGLVLLWLGWRIRKD